MLDSDRLYGRFIGRFNIGFIPLIVELRERDAYRSFDSGFPEGGGRRKRTRGHPGRSAKTRWSRRHARSRSEWDRKVSFPTPIAYSDLGHQVHIQIATLRRIAGSQCIRDYGTEQSVPLFGPLAAVPNCKFSFQHPYQTVPQRSGGQSAGIRSSRFFCSASDMSK